jgi:UDP-glucose 4-epimerase
MRDFVNVPDAVGALLAAMAVQPADAPVFNVCTGQATSVVTLAEAIGALCGARPQIRFHPRRTSELRHSLGSTDRARATLALPDPTPLASGLSATLAWLTASRTVAAAQ